MTDDRLPGDEEYDDYGLDPSVVGAVLDAVADGDGARLADLMEPLHAADIADLLEQIAADDRRALVRLYHREFDGNILSELDESIREDVIAALSPEVLSDAVRDLESDDVVDLIEDLDEPAQEAILQALPRSDRIAVEQALAYPEHSAGRLMQREAVTAPEDWTVGQAIDFLRAAGDGLPDQFYHIVLVDPAHRPIGYVTLGRVLSSPRAVRLTDLVEDSFHPFEVDEPDADVAYAFNQYHLISAPVVDPSGRLVGIITIDDAMAVLDEEHEEDILRLAGVSEDASLADSVVETVKGRALWLLVNLFTAILASRVIALFSGAIDQMVALAVLMPIVASMGGNAGSQSMAVTVRALATRSLTAQNAGRVVRRELMVGSLNGLVFGLLLAAIAATWFGTPMLGLVIGLALLGTLTVAALAGIGIPMGLARLGVDPALASGPLVTTLTDVVAFFTFLGLAAWVLL